MIENTDMIFPTQYLLCFIRHIGDSHMNPVLFSENMKIMTLCVGGPEYDYNDKNAKYPVMNVHNVETWLCCITSSKFLLTDSYHGMLVAIIFNKEFAVVTDKMDDTDGGRFGTVLSELGLMDRMFKTTEDAVDAKIWEQKIDYESVNEKLNKLRNDSIEWIKESLNFEDVD